jgi:lipoteichoic acid synthase
MRLFGQNHLLALPIYANFHNGSIKSLAIETFFELQGNTRLSKEQRNLIEEELQNARNSLTGGKGVKVTNMIFILVESYMSFVSDLMVDGHEVTPFLNSLKNDSSVYYNGHVHSNITLGESSDGQYILMTGLLPLRSMITVSKAHRKPLPSIVKSLQSFGIKESRMILPTSSSLWRQDDMCKQYGFTHLYASNDYQGRHEQTLTDRQVFELAEQKDSVLSKEPFFSMILTATMHQPYNKIADSTFIVNDASLSSEMKSYLNLCHYTDKCIGMYLNSLKKNGLYENSLIIITADHHAHKTEFDKDVSSDIPLFIVNGKIGSKVYSGDCNQLDIYTTVMDVLGIKDVWPGLGFSLLNESYVDSLTPQKWDVSELLLLSDYFE